MRAAILTPAWLTAICALGMAAPAPPVEAAERGRCGACHPGQSRHAESSRMSATLAADPSGWRGPEDIRATIGGVAFRVWKNGSRLWYQAGSFQAPVEWIFGSGRTGQTFVLRARTGDETSPLIESLVSYYPEPNKLDFTIGAASGMITAPGRVMSASDIRDCFGCHSSVRDPGSSRGGEPPSLIAGLKCERCHGDASSHRVQPAKARPAALTKASAEELSELCGQCHRTWEQVMLLKLTGVNTVRFQPHRLSQSKCYDPADRRIGCTACHDPHAASTAQAATIDGVCRNCHAQPRHVSVRPLTRAAANCAGCHMPKYDLPGAHAKFTDHRIRIAREGAAFPN